MSISPIGGVEPTPFQRDLSDAHHKRLADVINKTGRFLDPIIVVQHHAGVPDMVIQRILRHANVSPTATTSYIKTAAEDVRSAMAKLESSIPATLEAATALTDTYRTLKENPSTVSIAVN
jgi:hypothetical protein